MTSPPARGAWIATRASRVRKMFGASRPPRGGRGSQPVRLDTDPQRGVGRPPRGGRGSQHGYQQGDNPCRCRPPRGGRGSQPHWERCAPRWGRSPPARGAWIATTWPARRGTAAGRPPRGGRGSQLGGQDVRQRERLSPPARGAWIATRSACRAWHHKRVAPRAGGVDRNQALSRWAAVMSCRPPRGGRGSQTPGHQGGCGPREVAPREGGVGSQQLR